MFEKFTAEARRAVFLAQEEARILSHDRIGTGHLLATISALSTEGTSPKLTSAFNALDTSPEAVRTLVLSGLKHGSGPSPSHMPFTPNMKEVLELALGSSALLGDKHVGPEHFLAGLAGCTDSSAGQVLARFGITDGRVHAAILDSNPAPSPTAARICVVYLPVGMSIFKNGGKIYPDLAMAQAAHEGTEIATFTLPLADGEFFDIGTALPQNRFKSWGSFESYPDAFAAAEDFRSVQGDDMKIRIMVPHVQELSGKDSRGHDVILGRTVEYGRVALMHRLAATVQ